MRSPASTYKLELKTLHEIKRGDIFYANLDPVIGSEQGGTRPVLIIQNDIGNRHSPTVIIAAITSRRKCRLPTHAPLYEYGKLEQSSVVLLEQIRTIDKRRLEEYIGSLTDVKMLDIDRALAVSIGIL